MATQTIQFSAVDGATSALLFLAGGNGTTSNTVSATLSGVTRRSNDKSTFWGTVEDVPTGTYKLVVFNESGEAIYFQWVHLTLATGGYQAHETLAELSAYRVTLADGQLNDLATLASRLSAARAGYLDKLNVSGTLAHSDAAATYRADVSALATTAQLNARTLPAADYFDPTTDGVVVAANGISGAALSDAAISKIESALLDEEDGVAFKNALMVLIQDQLDVNDLTALTIADTVVARIFGALVADHSGSANSWGERLSRIPNAVPGTAGGLPTVDASNRVAGIAGTITTLDQLDTAQDAQHLATQSSVGGVPTVAQLNARTIPAADYATAASQATIAGRLPSALISGRMAAHVGAMADNTITSASIADNALTGPKFETSAVEKIQNGLATETTIGDVLSEVESHTETLDDLTEAVAGIGGQVEFIHGVAGTGVIVVPSHQLPGGSIVLVRGDTYQESNGRPLHWINETGAEWPADLAGATIVFTATMESEKGKPTSDIAPARKIVATGYVHQATSPNQEVRCELLHSDTTKEPGLYNYDVEATLTNGEVHTLVTTAQQSLQSALGSLNQRKAKTLLEILPDYTQPDPGE